MKKIIKIVVLILFLAFLGIQFIRPERTNPPVKKEEKLESTTEMPDGITEILSRSCNDCHSNETKYPWYSNVAPVSWSVVDHIRVGREELNFSIWATYSESRKVRKLKEICREVESRHMPHNQYLWIHWDAVLSDDEVKSLCVWTDNERKRLVDTRKTEKH